MEEKAGKRRCVFGRNPSFLPMKLVAADVRRLHLKFTK